MSHLPKVGFVSLGCPKALVDSERILTQLRTDGYEISPSYEGADIVVVNTCGFIDSAKAESLEAIGEALEANGRVIDPAKRDKTLSERGLDFDDAALIFAGVTLEVEDARKDYGEQRFICYGMLEGRLIVVGYTPRGADRHIFSMRKANEREKKSIAPLLEI